MEDYSPELITSCVQETFRSASGQVVLAWLQEVYVRYRAQSLIQSGHPNLDAVLAYRLGKSDLVIELLSIFEHGLPSEDNLITEEDDE